MSPILYYWLLLLVVHGSIQTLAKFFSIPIHYNAHLFGVALIAVPWSLYLLTR